MINRVALLAATALATSASPALAQTTTTTPAETLTEAQTQTSAPAQVPGADAAAQQDGASGRIADIVVTAQRRSESLQRVPIAVTAVTAQQLADVNVTSTANIQNVAPAVTFSNVNGFLEPRIRGIGSSSAGASVENSIATYIDGVYISSATGSLVDLSNVERIEVLKGPQGTLFGRNATGGLIQIVTKDPSHTFGGRMTGSYGNYNTVHGDLYVTTPVTSNLSADLAVSITHQGDGYGRNTLINKDVYRLFWDTSVRSKVLWEPTDGTKVRFSADYDRNDGNNPAITLKSGTATTDYAIGGVPIPVVHTPWDIANTINPRHLLTAYGLSLNVVQDIGTLSLTSISAYRKTIFNQTFDADSSPGPTSVEYFTQRDNQYSQEIQLASKGPGRFTWVLGGYFFHLDSEFDPFQLDFGIPVTRTTILRDYLTTESFAGYAQATWEFLPDTHVTGGIRYTTERRTLTGSNSTRIASGGGAFTSTPIPNGSFTTNTPTWRISVDHSFTPDILGYVSWNRGFKSGGYNSSQPLVQPYLPEYLDAYEAGFKTFLLDRRVRFNASAFLYDYRNVQVNTLIGSVGLIYNGAKARTYGLDVDLDVNFTDHLSFTGGVTVLHDRFIDFPVAIIARQNANGTFSTSPGSANGNRLPYAPDVTITAGLNYKTVIAGGATRFNITDLYNSGFYSQPDNLLRQNAYNMLAMSLTWTSPSNRFSVKGYVNNLLNEAVYEYLIASTRASVSFQPPRTFGGAVTFKF